MVTLRLLGTCDSCPSSTVTLQLAVEGAIQAAAPEVTSIEVEPTARSRRRGLISVESLRVRLDQNEAAAAWLPMPELADLAPGEIGGFDKDGMSLRGLPIGRMTCSRTAITVRRAARRWLVRAASAGWGIAPPI